MKVFIGLLLLCSSVVHASGDVWVDFHIASKHKVDGYMDNGVYKDYNEVNLGIGLTRVVDPNADLIIGTFKNSHYNRSNYVGIDIHTLTANYCRVGLAVGFVTGYEEFTGKNVIPMIVPNISFGSNRYRVRIGVMPVDNYVLTLSVGMKF